ncbi:glycosyl transferase [Phenylobacterium deserti]|uniref:Glycosyl transferase n=1 Tax=Phenylobacterium deserti TaxID=1914756 RepID=A0A328AQP7_9CAUL|nr:glycosyl transferase [Phenylobacterium deserti]RAK56947.1 glycosyl transferase [Phenylobacterium deserti]
MSTIHVFTSAALNYAPKVKVLFDGLRRLHPDWRLHLALADAPDRAQIAAATGADVVHALPDLGIPAWRAWAFGHSLMELATAIKPWVLAKILADPDCGGVFYLDPDVAVFSALDDLVSELGRSDILLTPHQTQPESTHDGIVFNEVCTLQHGVYNLGFVGVAGSEEGRAFARWWADRCYRFCRADIPNGIFTDQRWIDLAPSYFDGVRVLRSPRFNVAPWNLSHRRLEIGGGEEVRVNGEPLGFFHFSAIDQTATFGGAQAGDAVRALADWYRSETGRAAVSVQSSGPWGLDHFADGAPITQEQRWVYRLRADLQHAYPDPFASGPSTFQAWWAGQARAEFPLLFDPGARDGELARLSSALTTGYAEPPGAI